MIKDAKDITEAQVLSTNGETILAHRQVLTLAWPWTRFHHSLSCIYWWSLTSPRGRWPLGGSNPDREPVMLVGIAEQMTNSVLNTA
jgi:hypothetical protein